MSVLLEYQTCLDQLQALSTQLRTQHAATTVALLFTLVLFLALTFYAARQRIPLWSPSVSIPIAAASAQRYRRNRTARSRAWRLTRFYDRAVERVKGLWHGHGLTGDEFDDPDHLYARDLGIFGEGSLFELLCIARTAIGRRNLANSLLEPPPPGETVLRQEAIRELQSCVPLREQVAVRGSGTAPNSFASWNASSKRSASATRNGSTFHRSSCSVEPNYVWRSSAGAHGTPQPFANGWTPGVNLRR